MERRDYASAGLANAQITMLPFVFMEGGSEVTPEEASVTEQEAASGLAGAAAAERTDIIARNGTKITGFTKHGINVAVGDGAKRAGVTPEAFLDALENPRRITAGVDQLGRPFQVFDGQNAHVVVNPETGNVVSTNPLSGAGAH
jgi:hypothetical protein